MINCLFGNPWIELIFLEETATTLENYCVDFASKKIFVNPDKDLRDLVQNFFNKIDPKNKFKDFFSKYPAGTLQAIKNRLRVLWNIKEINKNEFVVFAVKVEIII